MGYEKEIILVKDADSTEFSALELLATLENTEWKETFSIIDRGEDFNWIEAQNRTEFDDILKFKTLNKEYIGFTLQNQLNQRFVSVNMDETTIRFSLDIGRKDKELDWFNWYHEQLVPKLKGIIEKVEWQSNYDNEIIKIIDRTSI